MAGYTTRAPGDALNPSTWTPVGVPGGGDTASVQHEITVADHWQVGSVSQSSNIILQNGANLSAGNWSLHSGRVISTGTTRLTIGGSFSVVGSIHGGSGNSGWCWVNSGVLSLVPWSHLSVVDLEDSEKPLFRVASGAKLVFSGQLTGWCGWYRKIFAAHVLAGGEIEGDFIAGSDGRVLVHGIHGLLLEGRARLQACYGGNGGVPVNNSWVGTGGHGVVTAGNLWTLHLLGEVRGGSGGDGNDSQIGRDGGTGGDGVRVNGSGTITFGSNFSAVVGGRGGRGGNAVVLSGNRGGSGGSGVYIQSGAPVVGQGNNFIRAEGGVGGRGGDASHNRSGGAGGAGGAAFAVETSSISTLRCDFIASMRGSSGYQTGLAAPGAGGAGGPGLWWGPHSPPRTVTIGNAVGHTTGTYGVVADPSYGKFIPLGEVSGPNSFTIRLSGAVAIPAGRPVRWFVPSTGWVPIEVDNCQLTVDGTLAIIAPSTWSGMNTVRISRGGQFFSTSGSPTLIYPSGRTIVGRYGVASMRCGL